MRKPFIIGLAVLASVGCGLFVMTHVNKKTR